MHLLDGRFFWGGWSWGFLKEGFKAYIMTSMSPVNSSPTLFVFTAVVHGLDPVSVFFFFGYCKITRFKLQVANKVRLKVRLSIVSFPKKHVCRKLFWNCSDNSRSVLYLVVTPALFSAAGEKTNLPLCWEDSSSRVSVPLSLFQLQLPREARPGPWGKNELKIKLPRRPYASSRAICRRWCRAISSLHYPAIRLQTYCATQRAGARDLEEIVGE
jgi:hypothetical protein